MNQELITSSLLFINNLKSCENIKNRFLKEHFLLDDTRRDSNRCIPFQLTYPLIQLINRMIPNILIILMIKLMYFNSMNNHHQIKTQMSCNRRFSIHKNHVISMLFVYPLIHNH